MDLGIDKATGRRTHCKRGTHRWVPENIYKGRNGHQYCLWCQKGEEPGGSAQRAPWTSSLVGTATYHAERPEPDQPAPEHRGPWGAWSPAEVGTPTWAVTGGPWRGAR